MSKVAVGFVSPELDVLGGHILRSVSHYVPLLRSYAVLSYLPPCRPEASIDAEVGSGGEEVVCGAVGLEATVATGVGLPVVYELITEREEGRAVFYGRHLYGFCCRRGGFLMGQL
jgi:hypothetical protein